MTVSLVRKQVSGRVLARVGTTVAEKYRIDRILGVGGMGAVYAATDRQGDGVAIKFLHEHFDNEPGVQALFGREAYLANEVGHPGAVPVVDDGIDEMGSAFLVMPLLEGETLRARWERAGKRLPIAEVGLIMADALDVLARAHAKGIVHRDIKPENLFITSQGEVRVLDFGIARRTDTDGTATLTGAMVGTPAFMPPEQALGNRNAVGPHSDCWAAGATIFSLLSGEMVHVSDHAGAQLVATATRPARSLAEAAPELSSSIVRLVDKALAFDPANRWADAGAMREALLEAFEIALGAPFGLRPGDSPTLVAAQSPKAVPRPQGPPWALTETHGYTLGLPRHLVPSADGQSILFLRARPRDASQSLWEMDLATGETREILRPEALHAVPATLSNEERARRERQRITAAGITSFQETRDGQCVVLPLAGRIYALDRGTGAVRELDTGVGIALDPQLSPDGTLVAYVREHDVRVLPLAGGDERRVTFGGTETCTHGLAEFIAQEELRRSRGFWWSPDGREILYEEADLSPVQRLTISDPTHPEKAPELRAYPRAGTPNAIVRLAIATVSGDAPPRNVAWDTERYPYLATATWPENAPPTIYVLDRSQRQGLLLAIDPHTGATRTLVAEEDAAWLNVERSVPRWLADGSGFLWSTEQRGAWELEHRDASGTLRAILAPAGFGYREVLTLDSERRIAYVHACTDPVRAEVWAVPLEGAPYPVAPCAEGVVHAQFDPRARVYAYSEFTMGAERRFGARTVDGSMHVPLPSVAESLPCAPEVQYTRAGEEGFHVAIVRPRDFDPRRRYPVLDAVYGGPYTNVVTADATAYVRHQWIADTVGAIVIAVDAHGTMWRGRDWERKLRDRVGEVPLDGHVTALRALCQVHPEMDGARVGIYGRSYGGYLSALAILRRPDVYKVAVAASPAVDWADYDTCYTERYLGMPPNPAYEAASLLTWAAQPPSPASPARPFLLVHGTVDDNVHFSNALKLAATMGKAGRPLEFVPLVGVAHMLDATDIAGPTWTRMAHFLRDHL